MLPVAGVFSAMVVRGEETVLNTVAGCMVRSKKAGTNEGGVCAGFGFIDSCLFV